MATATFRFYEELNDFLPPGRRKRSFPVACAQRATVKQSIEALGVPHTEVEVILVNGESVDFGHRIGEGDRIAVYPMFESLDIQPILRLRAAPLRDSRFVADVHLGRLARYLRLLGFDTLYATDCTDHEIVALSVQDHRVILTRDRELLMHRAVTHGVFVRGDRPRQQLVYLLDRLDLGRVIRPFTRCMSCNSVLEPVDRETVLDAIPRRVAELHRRFLRCPGCWRIYWRGSHWKRMRKIVDSASEAAHDLYT